MGKTTAARILAMALNCSESDGGEPCGSCDSCERIWSGLTALDVVEIDAASHRGVDAARDLRERAMYAPSSDQRFKVYIIDEAHMLTRDAWNALLKILEEPPPRVIFAFATTEAQKIEQNAAPVLSRCQRFDFRRVSVPDIVARLQVVLEREGVPAEEGAVLAIARRAEGGVRDALSLLDQVLSFAGDAVRLDDVGRMLGLVDEEKYLEFFDLLAKGGDRGAVFPFVQGLLDAGFDPVEFVRGLADALRALLVIRTDPEGSTLDLPPESRDRFAEVANRFEEVDLLRYLLAVSDFETSGRFRRSSQQRLQLEVLLLRLVSMDSTVELEELLAVAGETENGEPRSASSPAPAGDTSSPPRPAMRVARSSEPTPPASAPTRPSAKPSSEASLQRSWREAVSETKGLGGQAVALRGVRVEDFRDGTLHLRIHRGLVDDLSTFLGNHAKSAALRERLASRLGTAGSTIAFEVRAEGTSRRFTTDEVRAQKLSDMMTMDPRLREAVEELDLKLKE